MSTVLPKLYDRDVVIIVGQSNAGHYGEAISAWPSREQWDPNVTLCNAFVAYGAWSTLRDGLVPGTSIFHDYGSIGHSIAARMLDHGMHPALIVDYIGGATAEQVNADLVSTSIAWMTARLAQLVRPRIKAMVWLQGETEASGDYSTWRATTANSVARIRAITSPTLPLLMVQLPSSYVPQLSAPALNHLTEMRAEQAALVAADSHAHLIDPVTVETVDGIHWNQFSRNAVARDHVVPLLLSL